MHMPRPCQSSISLMAPYVVTKHLLCSAPEEWSVLLSQRRRWINSTIHNLAELIGRVDRLCGFCCCSMRAIVLIDLLSTLIQPVTVAYIVYLIYMVAGEGQAIPTTALIMLAAIYGLQAIIFLLHRKFEMASSVSLAQMLLANTSL